MPLELSDFDFPGVTPSRQKRSRATTAALLRAGAKMLGTCSLDELSIGDLCAEVNATVGAFYSRFESKEAYFNTLLALASRDADAMIGRLTHNEDLAETDLDGLCRALVFEMVGWMRRHEGVLRAALQHNDTRPSRWSAFKELARTTVTTATPALLRVMGPGNRAAKTRSIGFGFQVTFGTLVNAILNDPGPLSLHDDEITDRLSACLLLLLQREVTPAPDRKAPRKRGSKK